MKDLLLKNVKRIHGHASRNLSIFIRNGTIEAVAPLDEIRRIAGESAIGQTDALDCADLIALPGFVDSHTHLLFAGTREDEFYLRASGADYLEILKRGGGIHRTVEAVRKASEEELLRNGLSWLDRAFSFGTTTIEIKSGYGLDLETERKMLKVIRKLNDIHPVDVVPTFLVHTVPRGSDRGTYMDSVAEGMIPEFREYAEWFDLYLEKDVFSLEEAGSLIRKAQASGYRIGLHTNQAHDLGGITLAVETGVRHVDHLEVLKPEDADRLLRTKDLYAVFLPSAEIHTFSERIGQIRRLKGMPDRIVLSTDFNPGTSPLLSPAAAMAMAVWRYRIDDADFLVDAFTSNPGDMLFLSDRGRIKPGTKADVILLALDNIAQVPYFGTVCPIRHVLKNGMLIER
ncbi:MAG TPA: imidazolonepropionase [bacterium]